MMWFRWRLKLTSKTIYKIGFYYPESKLLPNRIRQRSSSSATFYSLGAPYPMSWLRRKIKIIAILSSEQETK
jgi:hypothetical protein